MTDQSPETITAQEDEFLTRCTQRQKTGEHGYITKCRDRVERCIQCVIAEALEHAAQQAEALAALRQKNEQAAYLMGLSEQEHRKAIERAEQAEADRAALHEQIATLTRERDTAVKAAELRRRMIDIPTAWELTKATDKDQHHARCSYRTAGMLCDCAACRVMEHVSGLLRAAAERAEAAEAELARLRGAALTEDQFAHAAQVAMEYGTPAGREVLLDYLTGRRTP